MIQRVFKYLCSIIIILLSLPFLILALPIYIIRFFVSSVIIRCYKDVDKLLTTRSSLFGGDSMDIKPKSCLSNTFIVDGTVGLEEFRQLFKTRVLDLKHPDGKLKKPEFQQYVTKFYGFFAWKWEAKFDVKSHIRMYEGKYKDQFLNGSKPVNSDSICDIGVELGYRPFRPKFSPWQAYVVHNYREADPVSGNPVGPISTACIVRIHHCLGDGFSMMKVFSSDLTEGQKLDTALPNYTRTKGGSMASQVFRAIDFLLSAPYELLREASGAVDVNSWHVPEKQLRRITNGAMSHPIPIDYFKEVKNLNGVSFTALIIGCFAAASRKFMMEAGFTIPDSIHCITPLPVPDHPDKMRNHATVCLTTLPVGHADSKQRLEAIEKNLIHLKRSSFPTAAFYMAPLAGGLFWWILPFVVKQTLVTAIMSNFPGPNKALIIDGNKITSMWFGGGFNAGNIGMGFSSLSYNGTIRISVGIDEGIVSKDNLPAKKLIQYFLEEVEHLRNEALV